MRVMVADDAALFRTGLSRLLIDAGMEVPVAVGDARELMARIEEDQPDVAILDIRMPPTNTTEGLDAARAIKKRYPAIGVLVLSAHVETHYAIELLESGSTGSGYLLKERVTDVDELTDAVRRVAAGGVVIDPAVVTQLVSRRRVHSPIDDLSERERDVLEVMAQGRSNQAISEQLFLSPKTVEAYVRNVFIKLNLVQTNDDNRRVLAVLAFLRQ